MVGLLHQSLVRRIIALVEIVHCLSVRGVLVVGVITSRLSPVAYSCRITRRGSRCVSLILKAKWISAANRISPHIGIGIHSSL